MFYRKKHVSKAIILIAILLLFSCVINTSLAYFTDSDFAMNDQTLEFGTIEFNIAILGGQTPSYIQDNTINFDISATEVASMDDIYRVIELSNVTNGQKTAPFYLRMSLDVMNHNVHTENVSICIPSNSLNYTQNVDDYIFQNWSIGKDGKLYYNEKVDPDKDGKQYIPLLIEFDSEFGDNEFSNQDSYSVLIKIEVIQYANNGYDGWSSSERPDSWPLVV